jgi:hypothetical protein
MCCPLAYYKKRIKAFKQHPNMVKAYIRGGAEIQRHPSRRRDHRTLLRRLRMVRPRRVLRDTGRMGCPQGQRGDVGIR